MKGGVFVLVGEGFQRPPESGWIPGWMDVGYGCDCRGNGWEAPCFFSRSPLITTGVDVDCSQLLVRTAKEEKVRKNGERMEGMEGLSCLPVCLSSSFPPRPGWLIS